MDSIILTNVIERKKLKTIKVVSSLLRVHLHYLILSNTITPIPPFVFCIKNTQLVTLVSIINPIVLVNLSKENTVC